MPGTKCDVCGQTWAGSRILAAAAPAVVTKRKGDGWPLPLEQFDALRMDAEREMGEGSPRLLPGDKFGPAVLSVPSIPRADFLWGSLGSLVVSSRMRTLLTEVCGASIRVSEMKLGKIGKREATLPAPIPQSGEPEDLMAEAEPLADRSTVGPYCEIVPTTESGWPPGGAPVAVCDGCLRQEINNETRQLKMTQAMWRGAPIFFLATTLWIIVTDETKNRILARRPTNIAFEPV